MWLACRTARTSHTTATGSAARTSTDHAGSRLALSAPPSVPPGRGDIANNHSTDIESPPLLLCIHTPGTPYSDIAAVLVLNDPPALHGSGVVENMHSTMKRVRVSICTFTLLRYR